MTLIDRRYSVAEGTAVKAPCRAATTANITLGGLQTIDGVTLAENDRVLVKNQSTGSQNGIYGASSGNWTRTRDFDGAYDIVSGTRIYVTSGSVNATYEFVVSTADPITVDSTSLAFAATGAASAAASAISAAASAAISSSILVTVAGQIEYETRAIAAAASIPLAAVSIRITRYATGSSVSNAVYVPGIVSGPMAFLDAAGHYWQLDYSGGIVNPLWFGASEVQTVDSAAALQLAMTAAVAIGGELFMPMMFKTLTAISVLGHVSVRGVGFQSSPSGYGFAATPNGFDTRSTGFKAGGLICGIANSAFAVATTDSVSFQGLHITYPTVGNAGVAAFSLDSGAGDTGCNMNSTIRDCMINSAYVGINANDWLQFEFHNIYFSLCTNPIIVGNTGSVDFNGLTRAASCGDGKITGCTFLITQGLAAIELLSGSGYRIANNKFQGSNSGLPTAACILVTPQNLGYSFSMTPGVIADNSMEGFGNGILFNANAASQGTLSLWTITGNEFFCTVGINMASGITVPQWMGAVNISANTFTYGQGGSSSPCIVIAGAGQVLVGNNIFAGAAAAPGAAVSIGANTTNLKIEGNLYDGTAQPPGVLTPSFPATGVGATNTTGYAVTVNIYSGTLSSVIVNMAGGLGGATVANVTNASVVLNPGDQIVVTYTVLPTWIWRALNP